MHGQLWHTQKKEETRPGKGGVGAGEKDARDEVGAEALADACPGGDDVLSLRVVAFELRLRHHDHHLVCVRSKLRLANGETDQADALDCLGTHEP